MSERRNIKITLDGTRVMVTANVEDMSDFDELTRRLSVFRQLMADEIAARQAPTPTDQGDS